MNIWVVKRQFQIFNQALEYSQTTQIDIVYAIIWLHNFIKIYSGYEENIYNAPINIPDNTVRDSERGTQQSNSTQMNIMRDRMADHIWEDYQIYLMQ